MVSMRDLENTWGEMSRKLLGEGWECKQEVEAEATSIWRKQPGKRLSTVQCEGLGYRTASKEKSGWGGSSRRDLRRGWRCGDWAA